MHKLSIITVNKNNANGLRKTIESIINQNFRDFEYIVIDGNSSDNSVSIIKEYSENIDFWVSEPDTGIYNAMNKGIQKAQGEYILFMNSGDCLYNNQILSKVFLLNITEDFIIGKSIVAGKRFNYTISTPDKHNFYNLFYSAVPHQATFTKKSVFDEIGSFDESFILAADFKVFITSVIIYGKTYKIINETISFMESGGISAGKQATSQIKVERDRMLKENFPYFYDDYIELYKRKRWSWGRLRKFLIWISRILFFK